MRQYERLSEETRNPRRTMADVIEVLHEKAGFGNNDHAEIRIGPLPLPSAEVVGLVQIIFGPQPGFKVYVASLATAKEFKAYRLNARRRDRFHIATLHGAVLEGVGSVLLTDGVVLRAVEMIPARLPIESSKLSRFKISFADFREQ